MASPNLKKRLINLLGGGSATSGSVDFPGLPDFGTSAALVSDVFASEYTPSELSEIQTYFSGLTIPVIGVLPRSPEQLPCVTVQRYSDRERTPGNLGDSFGHNAAKDTDTSAVFIRGTRNKERVRITIYAPTTTSLRDALYIACRECLIRGRGYLENEAAGIDMFEIIDGRDSEEKWGDEQKPHIVHTAEIMLSAETRTTYEVTEAKATSCTSNNTPTQFKDEI